MLSPYVKKLPAANRKRFEEAYENSKRPIATGEHDDIVVAVLQVWLFVLGPSLLKKSVSFLQADQTIRADGMVGRHTLDKISELLHRRLPQPPVTRNAAVTAVKRPFRCPPGALICPEPP